MEEHFFDEYNLDMLSNPNYTSTSQMDYSAEQLRMPLNIPYLFRGGGILAMFG